jgi:predicted amidophosphoribosyltransferase
MARTSLSKWAANPITGGFSGGLVDALFPPACPACRGETATGQTLCATCWSETAFLTGAGCVSCGREVLGLGGNDTGFHCDTCQAHPPLWDRGAAVFAYEGGWCWG